MSGGEFPRVRGGHKKQIRIGASGWHYKHWIGTFYPPGTPAARMLSYYLDHFDTVELNNSFYRLPGESALRAWRDSTPADFRFAVKASRFITHMKKLADPLSSTAKFFGAIDILGEKAGPVLFQLPPQWPVNPGRLAEFLAALPGHYRYAFEFRNDTWNTDAVLKLLDDHRAAYCIFDLAGYQSPLSTTSDLVYVRLHGPGGKYQGDYSASALDRWARRISSWHEENRDVWAYFDNDDSGYAPKNALELKARVQAYFSKTK
jgi:uncharacterized protein YecE (DUF72 family)